MGSVFRGTPECEESVEQLVRGFKLSEMSQGHLHWMPWQSSSAHQRVTHCHLDTFLDAKGLAEALRLGKQPCRLCHVFFSTVATKHQVNLLCPNPGTEPDEA
ncbi:UNVERIFIED_CONTAM: hypothetical protein K2H54_074547 [Gekko kuhli]